MPDVLLQVSKLSKSFGAIHASDGVTLDVTRGQAHAIIGPNGAGKTTLIGQLAGEILPDEGSIVFKDTDITRLPMYRRTHLGIARSYQITSLFPHFSALDNVALSVQARDGDSFDFWHAARQDPALRDPAMNYLQMVGLAERATVRAAALAHGEQRQLEIAMALACRPELLLLDEPAAGMGREDTREMIALLQRLKSKVTILLIEHDMDAVFAVADRITVLVYGRVIASGTPQEIREDTAVQDAYLGTADELA